jgi:SAM-dependent methyltransferase
VLTITLAPAVADRLGRFLEQRGPAVRSDHWRHFGGLNRIRVEGRCAIVSAGTGFDSEYELNFRRPTLKERAGRLVRSVLGRSDLDRSRSAYAALWSEPSAAAESPHAIIAQHYMQILRPYPATTYLEIGPGTGYLAALVREAWGARITVIDLPEILPLGFLYLHTRFPHASFALPGEPGPADFTFFTSGEAVPADSVDLAVNTASFGEMTPETVAAYFGVLRRVIKPGGLFFTVNREEKVMDGRPVRFAEYPWSPRDVDLSSGPSEMHRLVQAQNRMLMRLTRLAKCEKSDTSR